MQGASKLSCPNILCVLGQKIVHSASRKNNQEQATIEKVAD